VSLVHEYGFDLGVGISPLMTKGPFPRVIEIREEQPGPPLSQTIDTLAGIVVVVLVTTDLSNSHQQACPRLQITRRIFGHRKHH
jgi:hypothetical protein